MHTDFFRNSLKGLENLFWEQMEHETFVVESLGPHDSDAHRHGMWLTCLCSMLAQCRGGGGKKLTFQLVWSKQPKKHCKKEVFRRRWAAISPLILNDKAAQWFALWRSSVCLSILFCAMQTFECIVFIFQTETNYVSVSWNKEENIIPKKEA